MVQNRQQRRSRPAPARRTVLVNKMGTGIATRDPGAIFTRPYGEPVHIGTREFQPYKLNLFGIRQVQTYLSTQYPARTLAGKLDTVGEQMVEGATLRDEWTPLLGLLEFAVQPTVTMEDIISPASDPDVLVALVNLFFNQTGLRQMETMVKNSSAAIQGEMEALIAANAPEMAAAMILEQIANGRLSGENSESELTGTESAQTS